MKKELILSLIVFVVGTSCGSFALLEKAIGPKSEKISTTPVEVQAAAEASATPTVYTFPTLPRATDTPPALSFTPSPIPEPDFIWEVQKLPAKGAAVLESDFSAARGPWGEEFLEYGSGRIENGYLAAKASYTGIVFESGMQEVLQDLIFQTQIKLDAGEENESIRLSCRRSESNSFLVQARINRDGKTVIRKYAENYAQGYIELPKAAGTAQPLRDGESTLTLACLGNTIAVYHDDYLLAAAIDPEPRAGEIALGIVKLSGKSAEMRFKKGFIYHADMAKLALPRQAGLDWDVNVLPAKANEIDSSNYANSFHGWPDYYNNNPGQILLDSGSLHIYLHDQYVYSPSNTEAQEDGILEAYLDFKDNPEIGADVLLSCRRTEKGRISVEVSASGIVSFTRFDAFSFESMDSLFNRPIPLQVNSNRLTLACIRDTIAVYLEGQLLAAAKDDHITAGDMAIGGVRSGNAASDIFYEHANIYDVDHNQLAKGPGQYLNQLGQVLAPDATQNEPSFSQSTGESVPTFPTVTPEAPKADMQQSPSPAPAKPDGPMDWDVSIYPPRGYQAVNSPLTSTFDRWSAGTYRTGEIKISGQKLKITVKSPNTLLFSPSNSLDTVKNRNILVEADVFLSQDQDEVEAGLMCRFQDIYHFYAFVVSSSGKVRLEKQDGQNNIVTLLEKETDVLNPDGMHLGLACINNTLALYRDEVLIAFHYDDAYAYGDAGLVAGSFNQVPVSASFSNAAIYFPVMSRLP
ncbi:MAG: hypothetical protein VB108_00315 [Anaerolineaceae bacterium]|nr:hypothetical protein [Anaerolineaceae bacterium]